MLCIEALLVITCLALLFKNTFPEDGVLPWQALLALCLFLQYAVSVFFLG